MGLAENIVSSIYALQRREDEKERLYLGGSQIGSPCTRALWYSFRKALDVTFPERILRLFETGHREEDRMITELRSAGFEVAARNPKTKRQFGVSAFGGHFAGHLDGLIKVDGEWLLLECKTANKKAFAALKKHGCAHTKPTHWGQVQVYLGFAQTQWESFGLDGDPPTQGLYLTHCKDDDNLHAELILFDEDEFTELGEKARDIIVRSVDVPERSFHDPTYYLCSWCDFHCLCWDAEAPRVDCRTCLQSTPDVVGGGWTCDRYGRIPKSFLREGCGEHLYISSLLENRHGRVVEYAPLDIDKPTEWVKFEDGTLNKENSRELAELPNDKWPRI